MRKLKDVIRMLFEGDGVSKPKFRSNNMAWDKDNSKNYKLCSNSCQENRLDRIRVKGKV